MSAMADLVLAEYQADWEATGRRGRLEVSRSRYDDDVVSWEVLYPESGASWTPIAEFTTWGEAQAWAIANAGTGERCLCNFAPETGNLRSNGCAVHPAKCTCWPLSPLSWEVGKPRTEPNPECDVHFPTTWSGAGL